MNILSVLNEHTSHLKIDSRLAKEFISFANSFVNKNEDHIHFFGNGVLSTEVKWLPSDTNRIFTDIASVEADDLQRDIFNLPTVDKTHKVRANAFNLMMIYFVHRLLTSNIPAIQSREAAIKILSIVQYKFYSSILNHFFSYGVNPQLARKTYEAMNYKYDLRVYKTWYNLCQAKAAQMLEKDATHYITFMRFDDDEDVQYILSDMQTRCRSVIKNITELYYQVRDEGASISVTSSLVEFEGEVGVRDLKRNSSQYKRYLTGVVTDQPSFIRPQLVNIIALLNPSANPQLLDTSLEYLSKVYANPKEKKIRELVDRTLDYSFQTLSDKGTDIRNLDEVVRVLKGNINTSRAPSRDVLYLRQEGDKLIRKATGKKSPHPVSGERTAVLLYIVTRAMTMDYFTSVASAA